MVKPLYILMLLLSTAMSAKTQSIERLYVQTDKNVYHAGEIIWFRIDNREAMSGKPISVSKIVYAEVLNVLNLPVLQGKIAMRKAYGTGSFFISPATAPGRYTLRAYTNPMKNLGPGAFFEKTIDIHNIKGEAVQGRGLPGNQRSSSEQNVNVGIQAGKTVYRTRENIRLDITADSFTSMSVSVYRSDSVQQIARPDNNSAMENEEMPVGQFIPEFKGHLISGKIIHQKTGQPAADVAAYLFVPGLKYLFSPAMSDASGNVQFEISQFYAVNEIMVQTDSNYRVEIDNPFSNRYTPGAANYTILPVANSDNLLEEGVNAQVQLIYNGKRQNAFVIPEIDSVPFYGKPDMVYEIEDYVKFETMEEVLREYVTPVGLTRRNGKLFPFVYDDLRKKPLQNNPLVMVDGIPIFDMEKFMSINPSIISRINIVNRRYFHGRNVFDGIVDIDMNVNYLDTLELDKNVAVLNYDGLQLQRKFYSPVYETTGQRSSRLPDFRNVLFWSPDLNTGSSGKCSVEFYSSDLKGKFIVAVHGITAEGKIWDRTSFIEVQ